MSARDLIDKACLTVNVTCDHTYASAVLEALTAAGYRIVGPDEVDPVTVEKCAKQLDETAALKRKSAEDADNDRDHTVHIRTAHNLEFEAAAIRALASGGKP